MSQVAGYTLILPSAVVGLFAIWNWSRRAAPVIWLLLGFGLVTVGALVAGLISQDGTTAYIVLVSLYLGSGLLWAWWMDGVAPSQWHLGEWIVALLAAVTLGIAALQP